MRVDRTVHQRLAGLDVVAFVHRQVAAFADEVFLRLADFRSDDHLALALGVLTEGDDAVDFGDDGSVLRLTSFEELGHARKTAGDVLGLRGFAMDLGDRVAGLDLVAVGDDQVGADREHVPRNAVRAFDLERIALAVGDEDLRTLVGGLGLHDDLVRKTGHAVELLLHRDAFFDVLELHDARSFGDDRSGIRIPLGHELALFDRVAVLHEELGAVDDRVLLTFAAVGIDESRFHRFDS